MSPDTEYYRAPTLVLLAALTAVFGVLWLQQRSRSGGNQIAELPTTRQRHLLWLVGWILTMVRLAMQISIHGHTGAGLTISRTCMLLAPLMFLGSLAPQYFTRKPRILYVAAFGTPLIVFTALMTLDGAPGSGVRSTLMVCTLAAIFVAARWSLHPHLLPEWVSLLVVGVVGADCVWLVLQRQYMAVLSVVHGGILLMTALLFASAFQRLTTGVIFTVGGLVGWSMPSLLAPLEGLPPEVLRVLNLMKVITAVGMIVLVLEDEIASNHAAQQRDRRARLEMEKYTAIYLESVPLEKEGGQYNGICETVAGVSRFRQAAIIVRGLEGRFRVTGSAGMDGALEGALDALARRTTDEKLAEIGAGRFFTQEVGHLVRIDLSPLMEPGDELRQMNFREAHVIGIRGRQGRLLGALVLAGLREPEQPLQMEEVLPLQLLVARIGASREQQLLLRRLMQAERLAGLGQLAGGVAHELNNPLTVVTGYAELLAESESGAKDQALMILNEARRMKQIIEGLMRFRKASSTGRGAVSVGLLLRDIGRLSQHDLESAQIELHLKIPEDLPRVVVDGDQIRQVFLQVVKNAMGSLEETPAGTERRLSIEAAPLGRAVQVMFSDTGPGFADPNRAFDPFFTTRQQGDGVGLGLSICYSIIREHGGEISAVNLHPRGAAVVIELPPEEAEANARVRAGAKTAQLHVVKTDEGREGLSWNPGVDPG